MPSRRNAVRAGAAWVTLLVAAGPDTAWASERVSSLAVFPVENLSGAAVPGSEIRQYFVDRLRAGNRQVLDDATLENFFTRHRVRYTAGIDASTAELLRQETGADGVLVVSVGMASEAVPPKVALLARLVSISGPPVVIWADDVGLAGDDAPGFFELGLVNDYGVLQDRALDRLTASLGRFLDTNDAGPARASASKFRPKTVYRSQTLETARGDYNIVVLPFANLSGRRNAGDIVSLLFIRHLSGVPRIGVVDTGVVRQELLNARVIMEGGVSISDAETVAALTEADFVLAGRVIAYRDYEGLGGTPHVEFSAVLIERESRRVVWSSNSDNRGTDGVLFFGRGTSRTAHVMATQMVRLAVESLSGGRR